MLDCSVMFCFKILKENCYKSILHFFSILKFSFMVNSPTYQIMAFKKISIDFLFLFFKNKIVDKLFTILFFYCCRFFF